MHDFVKVPPDTTLLELLGVKEELPAMGIPSCICAGCLKPFSKMRKPRGYLRMTPSELLIPVIIRYPLCGACAYQLHQGGSHEDAVLAAVQKFMEGGEVQ